MTTKKYILDIAPQVVRDLREIEFYKSQYHAYPENVAKLILKIRREIRRLGRSPLSAPSLSSKTVIPNNYRYSVIADYLIIFEVVGSHVKIYRVLSGKMDYLTLLGLN
ncbi:hypothetical protein OfM1_04560 [Lactovum odontotermitis]